MNPSEFSNFTPRAQETLSFAREEAIRLRHNYVAPEHILLGLIKLGKGVAFNVLTNLGFNLEKVRAEVEKLVGTGTDENMPRNIPYTPRARRVVELAKEEAKGLNHNFIGTEHLLLGLLREGDGLVTEIFNRSCISMVQVHEGIMKELNPFFDEGQKG